MNPAEIDPILLQTLADHKVSPSEKRAFSEWLAAQALDEQGRAFVRHRAFAIARESIPTPESKQITEWLEDIIKLTLKSTGEVKVTLPERAQAFFSPGSECVNAVIQQFNHAHQQADVCVFTITDDRIAGAILAAHRRGVKIRIISDDEKSEDLGSDWKDLQREGIACAVDDSPAHMHHKFALFDAKRLLTGSFNWTRSASKENEENLIITTDAHLIAAFAGEFERLWSLWGKT